MNLPPFGAARRPAGFKAAARPTLPSRQLILGADASRPPWWMNPILAIVTLVVPIFCIAAYYNQFNYWQFRQTEDFVTNETFSLGLYSAGLIVLGLVIANMMRSKDDFVTIVDEARARQVLLLVGLVSIVAYIIFLGTLLSNFGLVLALFEGSVSAGSDLREVLGRIPGLTSLVQFGLVYLALVAALRTIGGMHLTFEIKAVGIAIVVLALMRSIFASERLAFLEVLAALAVAIMAFGWKPSFRRNFAPFGGIVVVFAAFAAGEYVRSWQYYQYYYASYWDFISQRFAGYFSISINNGSGAYLLYGREDPVPEITVTWVTRFPGLGQFFPNQDDTLMNRYLNTYAHPEFNNPGGLYSAFLDFNFFVASLYMLAFGLLIGVVYNSFVKRRLFGLMMYPFAFLGIVDLIRIVYFTNTRTFPIFLGAFVVLFLLKAKIVPRSSLAVAGVPPTPQAAASAPSGRRPPLRGRRAGNQLPGPAA